MTYEHPSAAEVSTHRRPSAAALPPPPNWGPAVDPPTHLPPEEFGLSVASRGSQPKLKSDSIITSAPRPKTAAVSSTPTAAAAVPVPAPQAPEEPQISPAALAQFQGGTSFDPLAVPLPPELAPFIYGWLRRLALQADLAGADRLLRDALAELTSSLSVIIIYAGPDGLHTLSPDDELPKDQQPLAIVGKTRRALVGPHLALVPITTATETIAVLQLTRNPRQPGFTVVEHVAMAAVARESASIMHHLVVQHLQRATELKADKGSLYRPEALESHRKRGHEGVLTELSPGWVRRTYPMLVITMVLGIGFAIFTRVPTYSTGVGIIVFDGKEITAPQQGTVMSVEVQTGDLVRANEVLVKLRSEDVEAALRQANTELESSIQNYLFDPADESIKKSLVSAQASAKRAQAAVDQRSVRALEDGVVSDVRVRLGQLLQPGDHILTLVKPGTDPEVLSFLPGSDRPRLRDGMDLQVSLTGFTKQPEIAKIYYIDREVTGSAAVRKYLGAEIADSLKLPEGSFVLVKAHLPGRTFKSENHVMRYHHGMPAKTEVKVESKRFISTLMPQFEKFL